MIVAATLEECHVKTSHHGTIWEPIVGYSRAVRIGSRGHDGQDGERVNVDSVIVCNPVVSYTAGPKLFGFMYNCVSCTTLAGDDLAQQR
jgi:hypothetical protein